MLIRPAECPRGRIHEISRTPVSEAPVFSRRLQNNRLDLTAYFCKVHDHASGVLELVQSAFVPNALLNSVMSSQLIMITYAVSPPEFQVACSSLTCPASKGPLHAQGEYHCCHHNDQPSLTVLLCDSVDQARNSTASGGDQGCPAAHSFRRGCFAIQRTTSPTSSKAICDSAQKTGRLSRPRIATAASAEIPGTGRRQHERRRLLGSTNVGG